MESKRHSASDDPVLDAALSCVLAVGVRRTTFTDVARKAGLSRMTLYRRWPDVRALVADLITREWTAVAVGASPAPDDPRPVREQLVEGLVGGLRTLRSHPLLRKILEVDPEMLLPYLFDRRGASQDVLLELLEEGLARGHQDGSVRPDHPRRQARSLLLVIQSYALSLQTMTEDDDPELTDTTYEDELRHILDRTLTP
ncbi:TetR/AcrR family transcriptional regulator [Streptomyces sp. NPDC005438]|uniref:TetR/AcrR family transcriptional regulator n=1 Tax=Streptomyces sp. NPDC005438 TaxID=3156880 RepID=UPI0033AFCA32